MNHNDPSLVFLIFQHMLLLKFFTFSSNTFLIFETYYKTEGFQRKCHDVIRLIVQSGKVAMFPLIIVVFIIICFKLKRRANIKNRSHFLLGMLTAIYTVACVL